MPKIVANGPDGSEQQFRLTNSGCLRVGRRPSRTDDAEGVELGAVEWEKSLSRNHAELVSQGNTLQVSRHHAARNPLFYQGKPKDNFEMALGEHFVIGETTFHFVDDQLRITDDDPTPVAMDRFSADELKRTRFRDADERIEVLSSLPDLIRGATDDEQLFSRLVMLILQGVPGADAVAIVCVGPEVDGKPIEVFHWEARDMRTSELSPSRRLIHKATSEQNTVRSLWSGMDDDVDFTMHDSIDWAFCTPIPGDACAGWALYVAGGQLGATVDLRPDVKFAELVASFLGAMRDFQGLQHQQSMLGRFFSPVALPMLSSPGGERALAPRQTEVTVLFCDLRGFSRTAEQQQDDIIGLLDRVSYALDVMTQAVHAQRGVLCDFQGDAALGFWGWPIDDDAAPLYACRAALAILSRFSEAEGRADDPLAGFSCGIGVASGKAVAGRLGTQGQFKIDVFGPVVNLASRLEGITKQLRVPILVDHQTTDRLAGMEHGLRFRRLACLRPYGMKNSVTVSELLPPAGDAEGAQTKGTLDDAAIRQYESALDAFSTGDWDEAFALLHEVPHWDQGKDFLISQILSHGRTAPKDWDGVVRLQKK
ncbi:MAG: adenylate/guanylate cyclase domain-containing protein [Pseudomonadota bacterium]